MSQQIPESHRAEEQLLGSCIINAVDYPDIAKYLNASHFFIVRNGWVWESIGKILERGESVEYMTLLDQLRLDGRLDEIGGAARIAYLTSETDFGTDPLVMGRLVWRLAGRRKLLGLQDELRRIALSDEIDFTQLTARADLLYAAWRDEFTEKSDKESPRSLADIAADDMERVEEQASLPEPKGTPSTLKELRLAMGNYQPERLYIYAQDSGGGKSAYALTEMKHFMKLGKRVLYVSLEMAEGEHVNRLVSMMTGVPANLQESGEMSDEQLQKVLAARLELMSRKEAHQIFIDDRSNLTLYGLKNSIQESIETAIKRAGGLDAVIVDHIGLVRVPEAKDNFALAYKTAAESLKAMAKTYKVSVLALSQFNNEAPLSATQRPKVNHIYGGSAVKHAADVILIAHRPEMYDPTIRANETDIYCDKNRGGRAFWKRTFYYHADKTMLTDIKTETVELNPRSGGN